MIWWCLDMSPYGLICLHIPYSGKKKNNEKRKKIESGVLYTVNGAYNEWRMRVKALMK